MASPGARPTELWGAAQKTTALRHRGHISLATQTLRRLVGRRATNPCGTPLGVATFLVPCKDVRYRFQSLQRKRFLTPFTGMDAARGMHTLA